MTAEGASATLRFAQDDNTGAVGRAAEGCGNKNFEVMFSKLLLVNIFGV